MTEEVTGTGPDNPNVLVLMCDEMQAGRIGSLDPLAYTPSIDQLVAEGICFTHLLSTHGQCVPSRASFMTGLYPHECGIMANYGFHGHKGLLTPRYRTLGQIFRDAGYQTAYFGKSHLRLPLQELGFQAASEYDGMKITDVEANTLGLSHVHPKHRYSYKAARDAVNFLNDFDTGGKPLFFFFSTNLPHPPFFPEQNFIGRFRNADIALPRSFYEERFSGKPEFQRLASRDERHGANDESKAKQELSCYYSMIAAMDEHFGQIMDAFKQRGLWDSTLVLLFSDHGDMMGAHRLRRKGTFPYDELYRVPCVIKPPADVRPVRRQIDDLLSSVQLPGTLVQGAGLEMPVCFHHGGFYDALFRENHADNEKVYFEHYAAYWGSHPFRGVRTRSRKYVEYYGPDATEELYDLDRDPCELQNLALEAGRMAERDGFRDDVQRWWDSTGGRDFEYYESDFFKSNKHNIV